MKLKNIKREIERSSGNIHHYPPLDSVWYLPIFVSLNLLGLPVDKFPI